MEHYGAWFTNSRMPDGATFMSVDNVQQAILYRKGRSMMGGAGAMRTAVCPHWNVIDIDDIYSGSAQGERYFTMHVLLGRRDPCAAERLCSSRVPGSVMADGRISYFRGV